MLGTGAAELPSTGTLAQLALQASGLAVWELDPVSHQLSWDALMHALYGLPTGSPTPDRRRWAELVLREDRAQLADWLERLLSGATTGPIEFRIHRAGEPDPVWIEAHAVRHRRDDGRTLRLVGVQHDITRRHLDEQHSRLVEAALGHLNDLILITEAEPLDEPGPRIIYVNDAFTRHTGYRRDEVLGKSPRMLQGPDTDRATLARIRSELQAGRSVRAELLNYTREGEELWLEIEVVPVADTAGRRVNYVAVERDITSRKRGEAALIASERHLQAIIDLTPECVKLVDARSVVYSINDAGVRMLGAPSAESLIGHRIVDVVLPEYRPAYFDFHRRVLSGTRASFEFEIETPHGGRRWMESRAVPFPMPGHAQPLILAVSHDITERKQSGVVHREYARIIESASDAIFSKSLDGRIRTWNPGAQKLFGYASDEIIGREVTQLIPPERIEEEAFILQRIRAGESLEQFETVRVTRDGRRIEVSLTVSPIWDEHGEVVGASKVVQDIGERKRMERVLRDSEARYKRLDERNQLVLFEREQDRIGRELHDGLGQQLTGVAFLAKALEKRLAEKNQSEAQEAAWIVRLLNSAVDHVRFLSRNLSPVELDDNSLHGALAKLAADVRAIYGIAVELIADEAPPELGTEVPSQIYRIVQEALNNALRHGRATEIRIRLRPRGSRLWLAVRDNGEGFERRGRPGDGGLGLRSMRIRAESLGGRLRVTSSARGTLVTMVAPLGANEFDGRR